MVLPNSHGNMVAGVNKSGKAKQKNEKKSVILENFCIEENIPDRGTTWLL